jgi:riboflavin transporter FmnP
MYPSICKFKGKKMKTENKKKTSHEFRDLLPTLPMPDVGRLCGVAVPLVALLARPLLSWILARASSRVMVGVIAGSLVSKLALLLLDAVRILWLKVELEDLSSRTGTEVVVVTVKTAFEEDREPADGRF